MLRPAVVAFGPLVCKMSLFVCEPCQSRIVAPRPRFTCHPKWSLVQKAIGEIAYLDLFWPMVER